MASYLGLDDFAQYSVGTAPTVAFGNFLGEYSDAGAYRHEQGAAGQDDIIWELHQPRVTIRSVYKGESLIANCQRSTYNGMPPRISFRGGVLSPATLAVDMPTAYVNVLEIACAGIGEAVRVDYEIMGLQASPLAVTAASAPVATAPFVWHAGAVTVDGIACRCQEFTVRLENGLTWDSSLDAKPAGSQRIAECIDVGSEKVTVRLGLKSPPVWDFTRDAPTMPIDVSLVIGNGYTSRTIQIQGAYVKPYSTEFVRSDERHVWTLEGEVRYDSLRSAGQAALVIT